jgi:hypothetical protein
MDKKKIFKKPRKNELETASKVLQTVLANGKSPLSDQFLRWKIWRMWPAIVGETMGSFCEPVGYDKGRLHVWVKNSARMQEIRFFEATLKKKVNEHVGKTWVRSIRFTLDRQGVPEESKVSDDFKEFFDGDEFS